MKNKNIYIISDESIYKQIGEVAEWLKAHAWKACIRATVSRVRIPFSPPLSFRFRCFLF